MVNQMVIQSTGGLNFLELRLNLAMSVNNEALTMKERTKSKFDQLLKAALDDVKGGDSKKKKARTEGDELVRKVTIGDGNEILQETDYNCSDSKKLVRSKRKEDKDGLINAGFTEESNQLNNKPAKNHYSLPAVFSRSASKLESKKKKSQDVIELFPCENVVPDNGEIGEKINVEKKNVVNATDANLSSDEGHFNNVTQPRKHRKKKKPRNKSSSSTNPAAQTQEKATDYKESDVFKHRKREEKGKSKLVEKAASSAAAFLPPESKADDENLTKESPNKTLTKTHKEKSATQLETAEIGRFSETRNKQILSVKIHRVDRLKMNVIIKHPLVRVHVVDGNIGAYVRHKIMVDTPVSENSQTNLEYILPAMTQPFKLKEKRSVLPVWEEVLHFNESFEYLSLESTNAVLFFEVLDFLPMSTASSQYNKRGTESGWYHIAWAFLKMVGANKKLNVGRRMQLQLYFPPKHLVRPEQRVLEVFNWWVSCPRVPYPATIYVTVNGMDPPAILQPTPQIPVNSEIMSSGSEPHDLNSHSKESLNARFRRDRVDPGSNSYLQWDRLPGQSCKVPNKLFLNLKTPSKGCLVAAYSHNGKWIACGCHDDETSPILIYEIPSGELFRKLSGHSSLLYELQYSAMDDFLVSASADGTARVWPVQSSRIDHVVVLPHPSYVYTAQFHPLTRSIVVSGCYDTVIRVWDISETENQKQLIKELEGHNAYINSICFNENGTKMYSGDSKGIIYIWDVPVTRDHLKGVNGSWTLHKTVGCPELVDTSISKIVHHPKLSRLLIQSQDGVIRLMDEESSQILQRYKGYLNICDYLRFCITPCGNYIFTGSEDYCVYAWNTVTGIQAAIYSDLPHRQTVHCAVFHPHDNFIAFCSFGSNMPVLIYKYNPNVGQLGISRVQPQEASQIEVPITVRNSSSRRMNLSLEENKPTVPFDFPAASSATRLESIIRKLDSVLDFTTTTNESFNEFDGRVANATNMSWGSTFDGLGINPNAAILKEVVARLDYNPQRSDELPFKKGDIVSILDMESDMWWIGRLADGQHGYVPATFFTRNGQTCDGQMDKRNKTMILLKQVNMV